MVHLDYSPLYKKIHVSTIWLWLYVYFNILYLLLFIMHKFDFYLRVLEFPGIKGRWY